MANKVIKNFHCKLSSDEQSVEITVEFFNGCVPYTCKMPAEGLSYYDVAARVLVPMLLLGEVKFPLSDFKLKNHTKLNEMHQFHMVYINTLTWFVQTTVEVTDAYLSDKPVDLLVNKRPQEWVITKFTEIYARELGGFPPYENTFTRKLLILGNRPSSWELDELYLVTDFVVGANNKLSDAKIELATIAKGKVANGIKEHYSYQLHFDWSRPVNALPKPYAMILGEILVRLFKNKFEYRAYSVAKDNERDLLHHVVAGVIPYSVVDFKSLKSDKTVIEMPRRLEKWYLNVE